MARYRPSGWCYVGFSVTCLATIRLEGALYQSTDCQARFVALMQVLGGWLRQLMGSG